MKTQTQKIITNNNYSSNLESKIKELQHLATNSIFFPFTSPTVKQPGTGKVLKGDEWKPSMIKKII